MVFAPYFLVAAKEDSEQEVESFLRRRFEGRLTGVEVLEKEDLGLVRSTEESSVVSCAVR